MAARHGHDRHVIDELADCEAHDELDVGIPSPHGAHDVESDDRTEQGDAREDYQQYNEHIWIIFAHGLWITGRFVLPVCMQYFNIMVCYRLRLACSI